MNNLEVRREYGAPWLARFGTVCIMRWYPREKKEGDEQQRRAWAIQEQANKKYSSGERGGEVLELWGGQEGLTLTISNPIRSNHLTLLLLRLGDVIKHVTAHLGRH